MSPSYQATLSRLDNMAPLQIVFHYGVNSSDAVFPIDLLAFCIGPTAVGNADFVNSTSCADEFGNDFWLDAETILFNLNRFDQRSFESFVARFHVRQIK